MLVSKVLKNSLFTLVVTGLLFMIISLFTGNHRITFGNATYIYAVASSIIIILIRLLPSQINIPLKNAYLETDNFLQSQRWKIFIPIILTTFVTLLLLDLIFSNYSPFKQTRSVKSVIQKPIYPSELDFNSIGNKALQYLNNVDRKESIYSNTNASNQARENTVTSNKITDIQQEILVIRQTTDTIKEAVEKGFEVMRRENNSSILGYSYWETSDVNIKELVNTKLQEIEQEVIKLEKLLQEFEDTEDSSQKNSIKVKILSNQALINTIINEAENAKVQALAQFDERRQIFAASRNKNLYIGSCLVDFTLQSCNSSKQELNQYGYKIKEHRVGNTIFFDISGLTQAEAEKVRQQLLNTPPGRESTIIPYR